MTNKKTSACCKAGIYYIDEIPLCEKCDSIQLEGIGKAVNPSINAFVGKVINELKKREEYEAEYTGDPGACTAYSLSIGIIEEEFRKIIC